MLEMILKDSAACPLTLPYSSPSLQFQQRAASHLKSFPRRKAFMGTQAIAPSHHLANHKAEALQSIKEALSNRLFETQLNHKAETLQSIKEALSNCLCETHLDNTIPGIECKTRGKVRDIYEAKEHLILVTTDRLSAFDRVLTSIPFKGEVLNQTSAWWFNKTKHIASNAFISAPDPNVTIAKKCEVFPVEFVVRGYLTGSTNTSLWTMYNKGVRNYCGNVLPEGMSKNERLTQNILTPTTKSADHDVPISGSEIVKEGLMSDVEYSEVAKKALSLFAYGQEVALEHGLLLVDTKYEFGKDKNGSILLLDEVHTPDSSRYWLAASYEDRHRQGLEPENIDKEFIRLWFKNICNPYKDEALPDVPVELVSELSWRYIHLYKAITGNRFDCLASMHPVHERISRNVTEALASL